MRERKTVKQNKWLKNNEVNTGLKKEKGERNIRPRKGDGNRSRSRKFMTTATTRI